MYRTEKVKNFEKKQALSLVNNDIVGFDVIVSKAKSEHNKEIFGAR